MEYKVWSTQFLSMNKQTNTQLQYLSSSQLISTQLISTQLIPCVPTYVGYETLDFMQYSTVQYCNVH